MFQKPQSERLRQPGYLSAHRRGGGIQFAGGGGKPFFSTTLTNTTILGNSGSS
ncbi:MAG: hypothetical protein ACR5LG_15255 [Sodalis sp. (in: enterobacteria)]|uniref:hypothetical protein n=1 Tax=Sodalis sp. (in: enterobacteria) TaxID=1898979 RepID=UPI003F3B5D51